LEVAQVSWHQNHLRCMMIGFLSLRSRTHLFDRLHPFSLASSGTADFDLARLHCLGNLSGKLYLQQAVLERRSLDLNVIFEVELTFEAPR
jgi:hypothetical protein